MSKGHKVVPFHKPSLKKTATATMSAYDYNKALYAQATEPLPPEIVNEKLENWFNMRLDGYAMLLCRERNDYTVFHLYQNQNPNPPAVAVQELWICLNNRGMVVDMDLQEAGGWEIWIKDGKDAFVYYLFPFDEGVIEV